MKSLKISLYGALALVFMVLVIPGVKGSEEAPEMLEAEQIENPKIQPNFARRGWEMAKRNRGSVGFLTGAGAGFAARRYWQGRKPQVGRNNINERMVYLNTTIAELNKHIQTLTKIIPTEIDVIDGKNYARYIYAIKSVKSNPVHFDFVDRGRDLKPSLVEIKTLLIKLHEDCLRQRTALFAIKKKMESKKPGVLGQALDWTKSKFKRNPSPRPVV